jgi:anti-sigma28 factor (negative regulator of flagellin synthesis)
MVVAMVTKGPLLYADDATLKTGMDRRDNPAVTDQCAADPLDALDCTVVDEERLKKIARLKQAVADGTYQVSPEALADKLIEHMLEPKG